MKPITAAIASSANTVRRAVTAAAVCRADRALAASGYEGIHDLGDGDGRGFELDLGQAHENLLRVPRKTILRHRDRAVLLVLVVFPLGAGVLPKRPLFRRLEQRLQCSNVRLKFRFRVGHCLARGIGARGIKELQLSQDLERSGAASTRN